MAIQFSARTDIGLTRDQNEDNFLIDRKLQLFIVCDGMGGHNSGEVASATAVNVVREMMLKHRQILDDYTSGASKRSERDIRDLLAEAVETANSRIHERGMASAAQRGMGTTLCLLLVAGSHGFYAHVGDSRLYRQRGDSYEQLTMDHSFYNEVMLNQPELASELIDDRFKNAITRALGPTASVEVDTEAFQLKPGDKFMLCSDGLHGYLDEDEGALERLMGMSDLDRSAEAMIRYANDQGGKDNTTAIIVQVGAEVVPAQETPSSFGILRGFPLLRHLNDAELKQLVAMSTPRDFVAGAQVWADNDETDGLYIILSGALQISRSNTLISRIGPGQYVGSITVMDGGRRSAAAHADKSGPAKVLVVKRDTFNEVLLKQQGLGVKLLWGIARSLAARLRNATDQLVSTGPVQGAYLRGDVEFKDGPQPAWSESDRQSRRAMAETLPEIPPQLMRLDSAPDSGSLEEVPKKKKKRRKKSKIAMSVAVVPGEEVKKKKKKRKKKPELRAETPQFVDPRQGDGAKGQTPGTNETSNKGSDDKGAQQASKHAASSPKSPEIPGAPRESSGVTLTARTERVPTPIHPQPASSIAPIGPADRAARRIGLATPSAASKAPLKPTPETSTSHQSEATADIPEQAAAEPLTEAAELAATASTLPKISATQPSQELIDDLRALKSGSSLASAVAKAAADDGTERAPLPAPSAATALGDDEPNGDQAESSESALDTADVEASPAKPTATSEANVPTIGDIFGTSSTPQRSTRRRHTRRGLRTRRGSVKGKPD